MNRAGSISRAPMAMRRSNDIIVELVCGCVVGSGTMAAAVAMAARLAASCSAAAQSVI